MKNQVKEISVEELREKRNTFQVIDVRSKEEFVGELGHIQGARLCELRENLPEEIKNFSADNKYVFVCGSGNRSKTATMLAMEHGIKESYSLAGGMKEWSRQGLPVEKIS